MNLRGFIFKFYREKPSISTFLSSLKVFELRIFYRFGKQERDFALFTRSSCGANETFVFSLPVYPGRPFSIWKAVYYYIKFHDNSPSFYEHFSTESGHRFT